MWQHGTARRSAWQIFYNDYAGSIEIVKIAVKRAVPEHRHRSPAALQLHPLRDGNLYATRLLMVVPEGKLRPGDPEDISQWLRKLGFRAQVPLLRDFFTFYGESEDGVVFSLPIPLA